MQFFQKVSTLFVCLIVFIGISSAQRPIQLKKRLFQVPNDLGAHRAGPVMRRHSGSSHYLIQFSAPPSPEQIRQLLARGAIITSHVPDAALVVAGADDLSWDGLDLTFVGRLDELDKLSTELAAEQTAAEDTGSLAIVEFHNDVDMNDARALVRERNVEVIERDNLLPYQLL